MRRALPKLLSAFVVALTVACACVALVVTRADGGSIDVEEVISIVGGLATAVVGSLIVWSRRGGAIGWIFAILGLLLVFNLSLADAYTEYLTRTGGSPIVAFAWLFAWAWVPMLFSLLVFWPMLFPDGILEGRPWRLLFMGAGATCAIGSILAALDPVLDGGGTYEVANPIGLDGLGDVDSGATGTVLGALLVFFMLGAATSLVVRFRRANGDARQQIKWIALAGIIVIATFLLIAPAVEVITGASPVWLYALAFSLVPASVGLAILRHGLFDVDLVIRRTAVYAVLTVLLAAVYVATVLAAQAVFSSFTGGSDLAIAVSTLAVAALFLPVRSRVQRFVDRRFYRRRYDAQRTLELFGARLREQVDLASLERDLQAAVTETMQPNGASLWLRREGSR